MKFTHVVIQTKLFRNGNLAGLTIKDSMRFYNVDDAMDWCCKVTGKTYQEWNSGNEYTILETQVSRIDD